MINDLKDEDFFCFSLVLIGFAFGVVRRFLNSGFEENLNNRLIEIQEKNSGGDLNG